MKFKEFAEYLERLEGTSSRLAITGILVELLKKLSFRESRVATYFVTGRVTPDFDPTEFGMAVKMVVRAVASALGKETDEIEKKYNKVGDMGLLVKEMDFGVCSGHSFYYLPCPVGGMAVGNQHMQIYIRNIFRFF